MRDQRCEQPRSCADRPPRAPETRSWLGVVCQRSLLLLGDVESDKAVFQLSGILLEIGPAVWALRDAAGKLSRFDLTGNCHHDRFVCCSPLGPGLRLPGRSLEHWRWQAHSGRSLDANCATPARCVPSQTLGKRPVATWAFAHSPRRLSKGQARGGRRWSCWRHGHGHRHVTLRPPGPYSSSQPQRAISPS